MCTTWQIVWKLHVESVVVDNGKCHLAVVLYEIMKCTLSVIFNNILTRV